MSRFAVLDSSSDEESGQESQISLEPVAYAIKEINWKIGETIFRLREFKVQNIYRNSNGVLTLRFINDNEAQKAFRHLRQTFKLKFSPLNVPPISQQFCFHCRREGHWGTDCVESQLVALPSELYARIARFTKWPDTFSFLITSKKIYNASRQITELDVARPHWRAYKEMTCKLGILPKLRTLQKLTLKSISSKSLTASQILANLPNLKSLSIVSCTLKDSVPVLSQVVVSCIGRMTKLTKLDLDRQAIGVSHLALLLPLTNLTQLRVCVDSGKLTNQLDQLTIFGNLKTLGMHLNGRANTTLPEQLLTKLSTLIITSNGSVTLSHSLPRLKQLRACRNLNGLTSAPNLTKLEWLSRTPIIEDCFDSLISLTLTPDGETTAIKLKMPRLKKLIVDEPGDSTVDLGGTPNLRKLVLSNARCVKIENAPVTLQEMIVVPSYHVDALFSEHDWSKLCLRSFQLIAESYGYTDSEALRLFGCLQRCSTLRQLKLDSLPEKYLKDLAGLTQLEELDLVNNPIVLADKKEMSQKSVLELSSKLPNTRIKYGFQPPTATTRSKEHWLVKVMASRVYDPFWECNCSHCRRDEY